jgi:hypothetical protein
VVVRVEDLAYSLSAYSPRRASGIREARLSRQAQKAPCLTPICSAGGRLVVGLWDGHWLEYLGVPDFAPDLAQRMPGDFAAALVLDDGTPRAPRASTAVFETGSVSFILDEQRALPVESGASDPDSWVTVALPCAMRPPAAPGLPWLSWRYFPRRLLEFIYVNTEERLCWAQMKLFEKDARLLDSSRTREDIRFVAGAFLANALLAGVHRAGVEWYRRAGCKFVPAASTRLDLHDAVACFASPLTRELLVVCREGDPIRATAPG